MDDNRNAQSLTPPSPDGEGENGTNPLSRISERSIINFHAGARHHLPPLLVSEVFERYRRGDSRGEVGLGLTLVQAILAAHGGEARAANRAEGGAAVTLRVPLTRTGLGG